MTAFGDNWIHINAKKKILHEKYVKFLKEQEEQEGIVRAAQNHIKSLQNAAANHPNALTNGKYDPKKTRDFFRSFHHTSLPEDQRIFGNPLEPLSREDAKKLSPKWVETGVLDHILVDHPPEHHTRIKELAADFFAKNQHSHTVIDPQYHPHGPLLSPNMAGEPFLRGPIEVESHPQSQYNRLRQLANHFSSTLSGQNLAQTPSPEKPSETWELIVGGRKHTIPDGHVLAVLKGGRTITGRRDWIEGYETGIKRIYERPKNK